jgi:hypothetical protein
MNWFLFHSTYGSSWVNLDQVVKVSESRRDNLDQNFSSLILTYSDGSSRHVGHDDEFNIDRLRARLTQLIEMSIHEIGGGS